MSYKKLGDYIQQVNNRNRDLQVDTLLGVSITKKLIPSIANTVGTDMSTYKIIEKGQFAYGTITSRNGDKISIALADEYEKALVSQIYIVFEVINKNELLPEYLMMWFSRPEFDRYARYHSHGSTRESFDWEDLCEVELPVPSIEKQREIVTQYQAVANKIKVNEQICEKLEATAQTLYKQWFVANKDESWTTKKISQIGKIVTGKTPPTDDERNFGGFMPFITIPDMHNNVFALKTERCLSEKGVELQKNKTLPSKTICVSCIGTAGLVTIVEKPSQTNQQINSIICHKDYSVYYIFMTMKGLSNIIQSHGEKGSVGINLNKKEFSDLSIVFPSDNILKKFEKIVLPIFEMVKTKTREKHKLTLIQSLLLSRLATLEG